ncbi:hypothetical protein BC829DRAFT_293994 [Chytridium lagenaria]|nr:hypothetical protein BC829DRAFT_293994 [Chytridium lagenaria]
MGPSTYNGFLSFFGLRSGNGEDLTRNPLGVRNIWMRLGKVLTNCLSYRLVWIVDNYQWCDIRSATDLTYFMSSKLDALIILNSRPMDEFRESERIAEMNYLMRMESVLSVSLDFMDVRGTAELMTKLVGVRPHANLAKRSKEYQVVSLWLLKSLLWV